MSYKEVKGLNIPIQKDAVGLKDDEIGLILDKILSTNKRTRLGTKIVEPGFSETEQDHKHVTQLYISSEDSKIEIGTAKVRYGNHNEDHEIVIVHDLTKGNSDGFFIINFNGALINNNLDENINYAFLKTILRNKKPPTKYLNTILDGCISITKYKTKETLEQCVKISGLENHLVTQNLQGQAPICTLIAVSNFKTVFEQCKTMDDVRAKFSGQELLQRLEDIKTLFGNRIIHKGTNMGKTVAEHIDSQITIWRDRIINQNLRILPSSQPSTLVGNHMKQTGSMIIQQNTRQNRRNDINIRPTNTFTDSAAAEESSIIKSKSLPNLLKNLKQDNMQKLALQNQQTTVIDKKCKFNKGLSII